MHTQQDMIRKGYQALVHALGPVDAIRFIQHFSLGTGNYTEERINGSISSRQTKFLRKLNKLEKLGNQSSITTTKSLNEPRL